MPITDAVKAGRDLVGLIEQLIKLLSLGKAALDKSRRKRLAMLIANLYFEPDGMPEYLRQLQAAKEKGDEKEARKAQQAIYERLRDTTDAVDDTIYELNNLDNLLRRELGLETSSSALFDPKKRVRRALLSIESSDAADLALRAEAIQEAILLYNRLLARLHDQLLGIAEGKTK